jgi:hypothetical protein
MRFKLTAAVVAASHTFNFERVPEVAFEVFISLSLSGREAGFGFVVKG